MEVDRVDLLAIKQQMASRMSLSQGKTYWKAMQRFFSAKLTRNELERVLDKLLPTSDLVSLHNRLLQGVLFNTTRAALPPPGRHTGWSNRAVPDHDERGRDDGEVNTLERKRRKLKHTVLRVGKYERAQIKAMTKLQKPKRPTLLDELDSQGPQLLPNGLPVALEGVPHPPATLQQDYLRALATPLCCESRFLPSVDEMRDRMSLLAYESGLAEGVDPKAALLLNEAIELHLKSILSSLFTLMRNSKERSKADIERKIRTNDCEALFDMTPSLASQPHLGTIERLLALPPPAPQSDEELGLESSSSSEDEADPMQVDADETAADESTQKGGLSRRSSGKRPSKSSLRPRASSSSLSTMVAPKREALLIDPSVPGLPKPQHPDLVSPVPFVSQSTPSASADEPHPNAASNGMSSIGVAKSDRELQNELFPEMNGSSGAVGSRHASPAASSALARSAGLAGAGATTSNGVMGTMNDGQANGTGGGHTSEGSSDDEGGAAPRKDGSGPKEGDPNGGGGMGGANKKKKKRRNLWEVVDSVKLLDGVLD